MSIVLAISLVTFAFHLAATVTLIAIARAPGWARVRPVAMLAGSAGLYSLVNVFGSVHHSSAVGITWATTLNLTIAALHASCWLWYTFADEQGSWRSVPVGIKRLAIVNVGFAALLSLSGNAVSSGVYDRIVVPAFGLDYANPRLSPVASIAAILILVTICTSFVEFVRRARRGVAGATAISLGFTLFFACSVFEGLVAMGVVQFIYVAEIGYLVLITPVSAMLVRRFISDARRLTLLSKSLADEVARMVAERDSAREAMAEESRMAALGRIAGGIGHEVNNPLQFLTFSLEELRDETRGHRTLDAEVALRNAFEGVDRIRRVVDGLRAYLSPARPVFETVDLHETVRAALRVAAPQMRGVAKVRPLLRPVPLVRGDEGKLVQAVVNGVLNAVHALRASPAVTPGEITITTRTTASGDAEIEIADNGPGYPAALLPTLGQPFVTTRATSGGSGLGLFVIRGVVDLHGGRVSLENAAEGGAVLRLVLPAQDEECTPTDAAALLSDAAGPISGESPAVMAG